MIGGKKIDAGTYDVFVELKEGAWTLILSTQPTQDKYDSNDKTKIWGAYGYDPKFDVVRVPMTMMTPAVSIDQFTIGFVDMTDAGGKLAMGWDKTAPSCRSRSRRRGGPRGRPVLRWEGASPSPTSSCWRRPRRSSPRTGRFRSGPTRCPPRSTPRSTASRPSRPCASSADSTASRARPASPPPRSMIAAEGDRRRPLRRRDRALPRRRQDPVRALPVARRLDAGLRDARGGLADADGSSRRFPDLPVALADYSQDADVTAELVDVGAGTSPKDYEGRDVRGKIVLADGPLPTVHRARLRGARRRRLPLRLPEPGDAVVRRRPRPRSAGATSRPTSARTASPS